MQPIFQNLSQYSSEGNRVLVELNQTGLIFVLCLFSLICVFLSGFCLWLYFQNNNRLKEMGKKLETLELNLQSRELSKIKNELGLKCVQDLEMKVPSQDLTREDTYKYTKNKLDKDELKSRFKKIPANNIQVPEKYRYVAQLGRSGLGVQEIAEILDVSQEEAEQVLSLARLSNGPK